MMQVRDWSQGMMWMVMSMRIARNLKAVGTGRRDKRKTGFANAERTVGLARSQRMGECMVGRLETDDLYRIYDSTTGMMRYERCIRQVLHGTCMCVISQTSRPTFSSDQSTVLDQR
jgi:hypothetical protein